MKQFWVYIGTYTSKQSKGISLLKLDAETGKLTSVGLAAESDNPSFVAISPNHRFLFSVNEVEAFGGKPGGAVTGFSIDPHTGLLTKLNQQPTGGGAPCHLTLDRAGKHLLIANYGGGSLCVLPVGSDGRLGPSTCFVQHQGSSVNPSRQEGPHAHEILLDPGDHHAYAADLGLDRVLVYHYDAAHGILTPDAQQDGKLAPGAGPRHFAFHPNGRFAYVIDELDSTVTAFHRDAATGGLTEFQIISTLPDGFQGRNNPAEVEISIDGKTLYGSNRGHDSIVIYHVDAETGKLTLVDHASTQGKNPRHFTIDPTGRWMLVANQDTDNIVVYRIDPQTGKIAPTGETAEVSMPVCIAFLPVRE